MLDFFYGEIDRQTDNNAHLMISLNEEFKVLMMQIYWTVKDWDGQVLFAIHCVLPIHMFSKCWLEAFF